MSGESYKSGFFGGHTRQVPIKTCTWAYSEAYFVELFGGKGGDLPIRKIYSWISQREDPQVLKFKNPR